MTTERKMCNPSISRQSLLHQLQAQEILEASEAELDEMICESGDDPEEVVCRTAQAISRAIREHDSQYRKS
jgi:predicted house-cleaning NTP pyrophosphatase (Maf/HAM1 superfamily)